MPKTLRRRAGLQGREVMAEFRRATGLPTATNMVATDWRQMAHALARAVGRHPAGRPAFLDPGRQRGADLPRLGPDLGSHSNNHFDVSLAMFTTSAPPRPAR